MRTIGRHPIDEANAANNLRIVTPRVGRLPMLIEKGIPGGGIHLAITRSLEVLGYRLVSDPDAEQAATREHLVCATQAAAGLFRAARVTEGEVEVPFGGAVLRTGASGSTIYCNGPEWLRALWLAMICRARPLVDELTEVPVAFLRDSGDSYDEFVHTWAGALQTYWRRGDGLVDAVLAAMAGTDPAGLRHLTREAVLEWYYPPIELFYHLTQRDDARFNDSLATALELHRRYWSRADTHNSPDGYLALGPLAIACLARDSGVEIEVESPYLPKGFLDGTTRTPTATVATDRPGSGAGS